MEELKNYQVYLEKGVDWIFAIAPSILTAIILLVVGLWAIRIINRLVNRFFDRKDYDKALESFLASFIGITLSLMLSVLMLPQLGVKTSSLVALVGAHGLAVGLVLKGFLANFAGGVHILFFMPFKIGDYIKAKGVNGNIKE